MWSVIIVHILERIFVFIEIELVSYAIFVNVVMIVDVVFSSLYNSSCESYGTLMILCIFLLSIYPDFTFEGVFNSL